MDAAALDGGCHLETKIEAARGDREQGIEAFLAQNDGEGWTLPETLCLADYGLGHDERAQHSQPVARRPGPRFYDWQRAPSAEESWRECHLHARNLLRAHDYPLLLADLMECRVADGEDYLNLLTDTFIRALTGEDGYLTLLLDTRARNALDEAAPGIRSVRRVLLGGPKSTKPKPFGREIKGGLRCSRIPNPWADVRRIPILRSDRCRFERSSTVQ